MATRFTYVFDAYCGWSYGFAPALAEFASANAARIDLEIVSGGLFVGERIVPIGTMSYVEKANARIAELTGAEFGPGYDALVADGRFRMDSVDAAAGFASLRTAAPDRAADAALAMQRAFYLDGRSLSDPSTYRVLATDLGVDADAVVATFTSPASRNEAARDFTRAARLGVTAYPTLLLHTATGVVRVGDPGSTACDLTHALDRHLDDRQPEGMQR